MRKPDIVIRHHRESKKKCSIYPLNGREDMLFLPTLNAQDKSFDGYTLLHVDGPHLSSEDSDEPLLLIDASWRWAEKIFQNNSSFNNLPRRSLEGFTTAYPRKSKLFDMPEEGLATVEAYYIARLIQGREDSTLLKHYYWREAFLEQNKDLFSQIKGISPS